MDENSYWEPQYAEEMYWDGSPIILPDGTEVPEDEAKQLISEYNKIIRKEGNPGNFVPGSPRNAASNFGYINKPAALAILNALPGIPGVIAKVNSTVMNANNMAAVAAARKEAGLPSLTSKELVKGVFKDQKGVVGDVTINGKTVTVSLEGTDDDDPTTVGFNELKQAEEELGVKAQPATPEESQALQAQRDSVPKKGFLEKVLGIKSPLSGIKSPLSKEPDVVPEVQSSQQAIQAPPSESFAAPVESVRRDELRPVALPEAVPTGPLPEPQLADYKEAEPKGLAKLVERYGNKRPNPPENKITDIVRQAAYEVFGPGYSVVGISGQENKGGRFGSPRHGTGLAVDADVVDPSGQVVTDPDKLQEFARKTAEMGATSFGYGGANAEDYMGMGRMHIDATDPRSWEKNQDAGWGTTGNQWQNELEWARALPNQYKSNIPTPFSPNSPEMQGVARAPLGDISQARPAELAAKGFVDRTPQEKAMLAKTLAGELSGRSLAGLARGDAEAQQELANMITTIENRAASGKYGDTFAGVFQPSQYNSLMNKNLRTTNRNYDVFKDVLDNSIESFYTGGLVPSSYDYTHYYNPKISNPAWGGKMDSQQDKGEHRFGTLKGPYDVPESQSFQSQRAGLAAQRGNSPGDTARGQGFGQPTSRPSVEVGAISLGDDFDPDPFGDGNSVGQGFGVAASRSTTRAGGGSIGVGKAQTTRATSTNNPKGAFGGAYGTGYGNPTGAGATKENTGFDAAASKRGEESFGGFSAGSLGGTSKGIGSGLGVSTGKTGGTSGGVVARSMSVSTPKSGQSSTGIGAYSKNTGSYLGPVSKTDKEKDRSVSPKGSSSSSSSGGGKSTILCGYFYRKNMLPLNVYRADLVYANKHVSEQTHRGYMLWAEPLLKYLENRYHPVIERLIFLVVKGWAYESAYQLGVVKESTLWGKTVMNVGSFICNILGKRATSQYREPPIRRLT